MKKYYSVRIGKNQNFSGFSLDILKKLFSDLYSEYEASGYFQESFGYKCIDAGQVAGTLGENIEAQIYRLGLDPFHCTRSLFPELYAPAA